MTSHRLLIKNGTLLPLDATLGTPLQANVLIEGTTIRAVQPHLDVSDCEIVDASNMIVMPGFVDAHRHTWEGVIKHVAADSDLNGYFGTILATFAPAYRPEDVYIGGLIGALEALDAGITTLFDWSHIQHTPEHTDAAIRALQEAGLRSIFGYGYPNTGPQWFYESQLNHPDDAKRVRSQYFSSNDQLLSMAMALRGPEPSTLEVTKHDWALARELDLRISVHVGSGPFRVPYRAIERLHEANLLGPDTQYVHATTLPEASLQFIAESGGTAVVTPAVEMQMGYGFPATGRLRAHGIPTGLGVDVITSTAGDLFTQMRSVFQIERALAFKESRPAITSRDVLSLATIDGARSMWLDHKIGTLTPGKQADIILIRTDNLHLSPINDAIAAVVLSAYARDVDSVFVAGRAMKRHGRLLHWDLDQIRAQALASRDYLVATSGFGKASSPD